MVGSAAGPAPDAAGCDVVEVRLDGWPGGEALGFARGCGKPVLVTARDPAEGGRGGLGAGERAGLLRRHFPAAAAVDVEIGNLGAGELAEAWAEAGERGLVRVASAHDFGGAMGFGRMEGLAGRAAEAGAEVAKFAFRAESEGDLEAGFRLLERFRGAGRGWR